VHQEGWVLIAFQNAPYQLLYAPSLQEAIVDTVMQGGDTGIIINSNRVTHQTEGGNLKIYSEIPTRPPPLRTARVVTEIETPVVPPGK
jgi:hypothetical protein